MVLVEKYGLQGALLAKTDPKMSKTKPKCCCKDCPVAVCLMSMSRRAVVKRTSLAQIGAAHGRQTPADAASWLPL